MDTKRCPVCGETKARTEYSLRSDGRNVRSRCKLCEASLQKAFRKENPDSWKKIKSRYAENHPDRVAEGNERRSRRWYELHREEAIAKATEYAKSNPELRAEIQKRWVETHPDNRKASSHRRRARVRLAGESFTAQEWAELKGKYGNRCLRCGEVASLTPDHVIPLALGGSGRIENIQPLCLPCNKKKWINTTDYRGTHACL